jgi:deazaflavin-dependent oxidoreductase (nitroreductase family)
MSAVAAELDTQRVSADHPEEGSAAAQRAGSGAARSKLEGLLLRYLAWGSERPHNLLARTQHKLAMTLLRLGYGRFDDDMVLTTTGRTSGQPRHVAVGAMFIDGHLYVVNPFGLRAHWYRNLLVDPVVTLQRRARTWTARASRVVDHDEAVTLYEETPGATGYMLRLYLRAEGIAETAEDFADNIDRFCFVRFDEVDEPGPPPLQADLVWVWPVAGVMGLMAWLARRRLRPAMATAALSVPALVAAAAGWGRIEALYCSITKGIKRSGTTTG